MSLAGRLFLSIILLALATSGRANQVNDPMFPVSHCYHWLNESDYGHLTYKYKYAKEHNGEFSFYTNQKTSFGAKAGKGIYCAKTPVGSWRYGDRVIRIDFVPDLVISRDDTGEKACGIGESLFESGPGCDQRKADVRLYHFRDQFYIIENPRAILKWSAYSDPLIQDLKDAYSYSSSEVRDHITRTLNQMERNSLYFEKVIFTNQNTK